MRPSTALSLLSLFTAVAMAGAAGSAHYNSGLSPGAIRHRRRAVSQATLLKRAAASKKCKPKKTKKPSKSKPSTGSSGSTGSSSGNKHNSKCPAGGLSVNGVCIGMLPDGGTDGGRRDTMKELNNLITSTSSKHAYYGQYAQAHSGTLFDGSQLLQVMDDLKESGAIFQPAVMPIGGWQGLSSSDDSQARAICNVMKKFTDEGIEVWLRFAHEVNWYQTDGTYQGNADDFKKGWAAVSAACKSIAPSVKMFYTPNVGDPSVYDAYYPDDPSTVDVIGIDFYPTENDDLDNVFLQAAKPFHDKYCSESTIFAMGETGLHYTGPVDKRIQWAKSMANAKSQMPHLHGFTWFNYNKYENNAQIDFKILDVERQDVTDAFLGFVKGA